jgi:hypothetical protein
MTMGRMAVFTTTVLAAALLTGAAVLAAEPQQQRPGVQFPDFATQDANKDGKVTLAEFLAALPAEMRGVGQRVFEARDTNKDGVITKEESDAAQNRGRPAG